MKIDLRLINTILFALTLVALIFITIYVMDVAKEVNHRIYPDNIEFYYDCSGQFITQYYNCDQPFQNLTGKYCGEELLCENSYKIKGDEK